MFFRALTTIPIPSRLARNPSVRYSCSTTSTLSSPTEHKVLLDGQTLYITKELAQALGWKPEHELDGLKLSLHGWEPSFFTVTPTGTDNERLSRGTIESSRNPRVEQVMDYLKDR